MAAGELTGAEGDPYTPLLRILFGPCVTIIYIYTMGRGGGIGTLHLRCLDSFNKFSFQEESN